MHNHELLLRELDEEFKKKPRDQSAIEMLHARYIKAWHEFEELTFCQCKLPRNELMLKRSNFG